MNQVEMRADDGTTIQVGHNILVRARQVAENTRAFAQEWLERKTVEIAFPVRSETAYTLVTGLDEQNNPVIGFKDKDGKVYWEPGAPSS